MRDSLRMQMVQTPVIPVVGRLIRDNPGTISLGQGVVGYPPPPEALEAVARFAADPDNHMYGPVEGIPALLDAIAAKLAADNAIALTDDSRIVVTAGGNMAFANAVLAITDPGDEVILLEPYYFNHRMAVTIAGCRPIAVPTDAAHQPVVSRIEAAITSRTRAVVTVSPNNPSGAVYPEATLRAINALCRERGVYHVHDEAYEYFVYDGARHVSPASEPGAAGHTISLFSLSKSYGFARASIRWRWWNGWCGSTGWRRSRARRSESRPNARCAFPTVRSRVTPSPKGWAASCAASGPWSEGKWRCTSLPARSTSCGRSRRRTAGPWRRCWRRHRPRGVRSSSSRRCSRRGSR
ncbi:MAG TPA: aminotransferase class I/II-fold pyridoxal phosphate-dependent enzyme [Thermoanaerobaculaceae bacterium]|nr:aminotransferase class I/II-fold pyridoxal phosphate-dependent enzyme [Thermoanaerobaculaceae bacterium]HQU33177.1 aminotransferase class I/II-fold pyridoxal phosphate-dependent enzyme [Thermoanaerobaculaceae bacterium]